MMKGTLMTVCALVVASAFAEFSPVDVSFARGKWNKDDFFVAKSWRFDYVGLFDQRDDAIVNHCPDGVSPEDLYKKHSNGVYSALVYKDMFDLGVTISSRMAWDWRMAPIIVIAPEMGKSADGVPEFRNHWEVCLYDAGINLWYHFFENGRQKWHKAAVQAEFDENASRAWSKAAQWHGLEILGVQEGQKGDKKGVVEFRALYTANGEFCNHHEVSTFVKEPDGWKFEDGELVGEKPVVREEPKVGRNDPCPCGSGKKYKKCCGRDKQ